MYPVILQCSDHFEAGTIAHMGKARIFVAAKVPLQNATILCPIEYGAPCFELSHTSREEPMIDLMAMAQVDRETEVTYIRKERDWLQRAAAEGRFIDAGRLLPMLPPSLQAGNGNANGNGNGGNGHGPHAHGPTGGTAAHTSAK